MIQTVSYIEMLKYIFSLKLLICIVFIFLNIQANR